MQALRAENRKSGAALGEPLWKEQCPKAEEVVADFGDVGKWMNSQGNDGGFGALTPSHRDGILQYKRAPLAATCLGA